MSPISGTSETFNTWQTLCSNSFFPPFSLHSGLSVGALSSSNFLCSRCTLTDVLDWRTTLCTCKVLYYIKTKLQSWFAIYVTVTSLKKWHHSLRIIQFVSHRGTTPSSLQLRIRCSLCMFQDMLDRKSSFSSASRSSPLTRMIHPKPG